MNGIGSDAPRWQVIEDKQIFDMGGAQLIQKTANGYIGGTDCRKDGQAAGY